GGRRATVEHADKLSGTTAGAGNGGGKIGRRNSPGGADVSADAQVPAHRGPAERSQRRAGQVGRVQVQVERCPAESDAAIAQHLLPGGTVFHTHAIRNSAGRTGGGIGHGERGRGAVGHGGAELALEHLASAAHHEADGIVILVRAQKTKLTRGQLLLVKIRDVGRGNSGPVLGVQLHRKGREERKG